MNKQTKPTITIIEREQYGKVVYHPLCDKSKLFASIAGTTTLTRETLKNVTLLGYVIEVRKPFAPIF